MPQAADSYQAHFERRWGQLVHAPVRALAWLLDAPDLLDVHAPAWQGKIATLGPVSAATGRWVAALDQDPSALARALGDKPPTRLGLYAEKLLAFYFAAQGRLLAHGLQVRAAHDATVGEFDFLLDAGEGAALHIEFATKFYLLRRDLQGGAGPGLDGFVGPNLADSLGRKMDKVFGQQLRLGAHPAAQAVLPRPVTGAQALVKGWLFHPPGDSFAMAGIAPDHCRGFWCAASGLAAVGGENFVILPRLEWLAPYRSASAATMLDRPQLLAALAAHFAQSQRPLLVAVVSTEPGAIVETARGFVVPEDWQERARLVGAQAGRVLAGD